MNNITTQTFFIIFFLIVLPNKSNANRAVDLLPSETLTLMVKNANDHPEIERLDATKSYLPRMKTENLSRQEQYYLGEVYFWNYMPKDSKEAFKELLKGEDNYARAAWQRTLQIEFRAFQNIEHVEKMLPVFRDKFKPLKLDLKYMYGQVSNLAEHYKKKGNHSRVVKLIMDEIDSLDYQGAYSSYLLPAFHFESFKKEGLEKEALKMLSKAHKEFKSALHSRKQQLEYDEPDFSKSSKRLRVMETIVTRKTNNLQMDERFEELIDSLNNAINHFSKPQ